MFGCLPVYNLIRNTLSILCSLTTDMTLSYPNSYPLDELRVSLGIGNLKFDLGHFVEARRRVDGRKCIKTYYIELIKILIK